MVRTAGILLFGSGLATFVIFSTLSSILHFLDKTRYKNMEAIDFAKENRVYIVCCCFMLSGIGIKILST